MLGGGIGIRILWQRVAASGDVVQMNVHTFAEAIGPTEHGIAGSS